MKVEEKEGQVVNAYEQLASFCKMIEKQLKEKNKVLNQEIKTHKILKENLNNIYDAKIISLDTYRKVKYNYKCSEGFIEVFKVEYRRLEEQLESIKSRLELLKPQKSTVGQVHELSKFKRKTS